jgi:hypothetical protein
VKKWDWLRASTAENTWKNVDSEVPVPIFSQPLRDVGKKWALLVAKNAPRSKINFKKWSASSSYPRSDSAIREVQVT